MAREPKAKRRGQSFKADQARVEPLKKGGGGGGITSPWGGGNIGQQPHVKTEKMANKVRMLRALGNSIEAIAFACDCSPETLGAHYKTELELGQLEANAQVGASIFQTALGEKVPCLDCEGGRRDDGKKCRTCHATGQVWRLEPNTTAQIWWSKNRMGWTDQQRIEHTGAGGGPILTEHVQSGRTVQDRLKAIRERQKALPDK
jgi:hypothetical protein